jgi:hypothetical protein
MDLQYYTEGPVPFSALAENAKTIAKANLPLNYHIGIKHAQPIMLHDEFTQGNFLLGYYF